LAPSELQTVLGVAIVSVMFLLLQALVRPYRVQWVNQLQLLSGWCLVMLSMLNAASSSVFTSLGVNVANTPFEALGAEADWMMFLLLWPPVIALALCTAYEMKALTLALTGLFGMSVGALIGGFAVSLLGAVVGALVGVLVGTLVGTRSWWLHCCQHCRSHWWRKDGGGSGAERHASELSEMGSMVSHVSSGGGDQYAEMANEQLLAERRRHEQEKEQLLQEKEQLLQEKEQEKEQLLQEKEQEMQRHVQLLQEKEQEKEQLLQEKEQEQEKAELLARLEELQGRGAQ
jgi:prepilin signal peptidase PulO-like enzyme (type II secretory pathway)